MVAEEAAAEATRRAGEAEQSAQLARAEEMVVETSSHQCQWACQQSQEAAASLAVCLTEGEARGVA